MGFNLSGTPVDKSCPRIFIHRTDLLRITCCKGAIPKFAESLNISRFVA